MTYVRKIAAILLMGALVAWPVAHRASAESIAPHITKMAISDGGRYLAAASSRGWLTLWDLLSGKPVRTFKAHDDDIYTIRFVTAGDRLLTGADDATAKIWSVPDLKNLRTIETTGKVTGGDLSKDGRTLVLGLWDGTMQKWDVETGTLATQVQGHLFGRVILNISAAGDQIISGGSDQMIRVRDFKDLGFKYFLKSGEMGNKAHMGSVYGARLLGDGKAVSLASRGGAQLDHLVLWDLESKAPLKKARGTASIAGLSFTSDMTLLVYVEGSKRTRDAIVFDVGDWKAVRNLNSGEFLRDALISPNGRMVITGTASGRIEFWDTAMGALRVSAWCRFDHACGLELPDGSVRTGDDAWHVLAETINHLGGVTPQ